MPCSLPCFVVPALTRPTLSCLLWRALLCRACFGAPYFVVPALARPTLSCLLWRALLCRACFAMFVRPHRSVVKTGLRACVGGGFCEAVGSGENDADQRSGCSGDRRRFRSRCR